jgi:UDP-N-acetylglucosamine:LPS N-acetylglucosamine transferase
VEHRFLILSARMGAGHDAVAAELSRRLTARGDQVERLDVLELLPAGAGPALVRSYHATLRRLPWAYQALYPVFFGTGRVPRPGSGPLTALAARAFRAEVARYRPHAVVSTFHLAAQLTGRLRAAGDLAVPSTVVVTDFAVHRQWLHAGNDLHVCVTPSGAERAAAVTGRAARTAGPVVPPSFGAVREEDVARWAARFAARAPGRPAVLVSAGAWGVGSRLEETGRLLARAGYLPVLLCGRNEGLRRRASQVPGVWACGWLEDLPALMGACAALVDNAAGQTAVQALAAGLPVVGYRPIPGHGAEGVREMAAAGLSSYAADDRALPAVLEGLVAGEARERALAAGRSAFRADAAELLLHAAGRREGDPRRPAGED